MGLLDQLEGKKKFVTSRGKMNMFQPGLTTFIINTFNGGVNNVYVPSTDGVTATNMFTGADPALSTTNIGFKWGEKCVNTIQNHSNQPIYVRAHFCGVNDNLPVGIASFAPSAAKEPLIEILAACFTATGLTVYNGDQGIYNNDLYNVGEGMAGAGAGDLLAYVQTQPVSHGIAVPHGSNPWYNPDWGSIVKRYHMKSFVLAPGENRTLQLSSENLMYRRLTTEAGATLFGELDIWNTFFWSHNKLQKFIMWEISGSLIGQSNQVAQAAGTSHRATWEPTAATNDTLDFNAIDDYVLTHGGTLYFYFHKEYMLGVATNLEREKVLLRSTPQYVGAPDEAYGVHGELTIS